MKALVYILPLAGVATAACSAPSDNGVDLDGDGYNGCLEAMTATCDCDDDDSNVYPSALELNDDVDQDCNGIIEWSSMPIVGDASVEHFIIHDLKLDNSQSTVWSGGSSDRSSGVLHKFNLNIPQFDFENVQRLGPGEVDSDASIDYLDISTTGQVMAGVNEDYYVTHEMYGHEFSSVYEVIEDTILKIEDFGAPSINSKIIGLGSINEDMYFVGVLEEDFETEQIVAKVELYLQGVSEALWSRDYDGAIEVIVSNGKVGVLRDNISTSGVSCTLEQITPDNEVEWSKTISNSTSCKYLSKSASSTESTYCFMSNNDTIISIDEAGTTVTKTDIQHISEYLGEPKAISCGHSVDTFLLAVAAPSQFDSTGYLSLLLIHRDGRIVSRSDYPSMYSTEATALLQVEEGGYVVAGEAVFTFTVGTFFIRTDNQGAAPWDF